MKRLAFVLVFACGHPQPPAPPTNGSAVPADAQVEIDAAIALDRDLPRLAERAVKVFRISHRRSQQPARTAPPPPRC